MKIRLQGTKKKSSEGKANRARERRAFEGRTGIRNIVGRHVTPIEKELHFLLVHETAVKDVLSLRGF